MNITAFRIQSAGRWFPLLLAILALAASVPAWRLPLSGGDDQVQRARLMERHPIKDRGHLLDTHRFGPATSGLFEWFHPGVTRGAMEGGALPWWTDEAAKQWFWRPLSAATHWLDYRLWPSRALPMHIHSALWFCGFVMAAWFLYRGVGAAGVTAGVAAVLLTVRPENWQALSWVAARNALVAALFVVLTMWCHHRRVSGGSSGWAVAALCAFAAGLLGGEAALAAMGYLVSYTLFMDARPWRARLASLAPFAVVAAAWRAAYGLMGFGVAASGLYIDPVAEPWRFLANLVEWGPILGLDVFSVSLTGRYALLAPGVKPWAWGMAVLALVALWAAFRPLLRRDRSARFWMLGVILAIPLACLSTSPDARNTLYAALGAAPLVAALVVGVMGKHDWLPASGIRRMALQEAAIVLIGLQVLLPLLGHGKRWRGLLRPLPEPVAVAPELKASRGEELVIVNAPDAMTYTYLCFALARESCELPLRIRALSSALGDVAVHRTGTNEVTVVSLSGPLCPARPRPEDLPSGAPWIHGQYKAVLYGSAFREETAGFRVGDGVALPGMAVRVDRVDDRRLPWKATFSFDRALEDARYRWVFWDAARGRYAVFTVPRVGETLRLAGPLRGAR